MLKKLLGDGCRLVSPKSPFQCSNLRMACSTYTPTAGIIVIGDEILKGQVRDTNSHYITTRLYNLGVRVMRVSVISDDIDEISHEVRRFAQLYNYVITSGGVGPTHDDVTFEGVAKAFGESVAPHPELLRLCSEFYNTSDLSSPVMKLASVPKSAKLTYGFDSSLGCKSKFPNISIENVYIFPGVPPILEKSFNMLCEDLFGGAGSKFYNTELYLDAREVAIAEQLNRVVEEFPNVSFGSYPQLANSYYGVRLTVEANSNEELVSAINRLKQVLPQGCIVNYDCTPLEFASDKIKFLCLEPGMEYVKKVWESLLHTLENFQSSEIALCVDGSLYGLAVLHLFHAAQQELNRTASACPAIIIRDSSASLAADNLLEEIVNRYFLDVKAGPCNIFSAIYCLHSSCPSIRLLVVGSKCKSTPFQKLLEPHFGPNSKFLAPLVTWSDRETLTFLRALSLPYC